MSINPESLLAGREKHLQSDSDAKRGETNNLTIKDKQFCEEVTLDK